MTIGSFNERWSSDCRGALRFGVVLGIVACVGCGSDASSGHSNGGEAAAGASGASDDNPSGGKSNSTSGDDASTAEETCPHVVDVSDNSEVEPHDAEVVATDGKALFILVGNGQLLEPTTEHVIYELDGNTFKEVARVPYTPSDEYVTESTLAVTADAILTDSAEGDVFSIMRIPRDGGEAEAIAQYQPASGFSEPPFLSDGEYLYFPLAGEEEDLIYRIPVTGGDPEALDSTSYFVTLWGEATASDSHVYQLDGGITSSASLTTIDASTLPVSWQYASYNLGTCTTAPSKLIRVDGHLYTGCGSEADGASNGMGNVYRLDTLETSGDEVVEGTLVFATEHWDYEDFVVYGDYLYYEFPDYDDEGGEGIYRVPLAGGEPKLVLPTDSLVQMLVVGSSLYVTSYGCGVQRLAL
jgi:hypothetical protein